jgi:hypothetical protein
MDINNYASKGVAGTALGLGAGALGIELLRGGLGNLFGGCNNRMGNGWNAVPVCSENMAVNRFELDQLKELVNKDMEIAYLKGRDEAKSDSLELYKYIDGRFRGVEAQISNQAVVNAQITANIACMQNSIETLMGLTKTVIPIGNVCPAPMPQYNSWTAPTTPAAGG